MLYEFAANYKYVLCIAQFRRTEIEILFHKTHKETNPCKLWQGL